MTRLLVVILLFFSDGIHGLRPNYQKPAVNSTPFPMKKEGDTKGTATKSRDIIGYNDDCFGLVFLSGLLIAKDYVFCSTFAALSFVAAQTNSTRRKEQQHLSDGMKKAEQYLIPSAVCLNSYFSSSIVLTVCHDGLRKLSPALDTPPTWENPVLTSATLFSILYGLFMSSKKNDV